MDSQAKIEESHGLWELAIVRLAAFVEAKAPQSMIDRALAEERAAFKVWQAVSDIACSE
jgi:hypothetical protein